MLIAKNVRTEPELTDASPCTYVRSSDCSQIRDKIKMGLGRGFCHYQTHFPLRFRLKAYGVY